MLHDALKVRFHEMTRTLSGYSGFQRDAEAGMEKRSPLWAPLPTSPLHTIPELVVGGWHVMDE